MANFKVVVEPTATIEMESVLYAGLRAFNTEHAGPMNRRDISVLLKDDSGSVVGGVSGTTKWNWMFVSLLFVEERARGQGYGRALMLAAEREAVAVGCSHVYVDTFSFQARGFYERLGYEVFGQLEDFPPGHTRYFLRKMELDGG